MRLFEILKNKLLLLNIQLGLSGFALGVVSWSLVTLIKNSLLKNLRLKVNPWTQIFFHPHDSSLGNYIFLCLIFGLCGLSLYILKNHKAIRFVGEKIQKINYLSFLFPIGISMTILASAYFLSPQIRIFMFLIVTVMPLFLVVHFGSPDSKKWMKVGVGILFFFVILEPLILVRGPSYLMNEYEDIYVETYVNGSYINNKDVSESLNGVDLGAMIRFFYELNNKYEEPYARENLKSDEIDYWVKFKYRDLRPIQNNFILMNQVHNLVGIEFIKDGMVGDKDFFDNLKSIDLESIKQIYLKNILEYSHQNMSRGQINHIGHVLNPINEYQLGKPLKDIYVQYGLGNTFIMKWTMNLFGGVSIENYYKCYIYCVIYFMLVFLMLYLLFRDWLYVFGVFSFVSGAYLWQGFIALAVAPGIIPTIHIFDTTVLIFLLLFFRHHSLTSMGFVALSTLLSIIVNPQFGAMLAGAVLVSIFLYVFENKRGRGKYVWFLYLFIFLILDLFIFKLASSDPSGGTFKYFLLGLFSWRPHTIIVILTICYLVVSYYFLCLLKEYRNYLKYAYLFVFVYVQGLFIYYYWSGLPNHLPTVIPFGGLQIFLMVFIAERVILGGGVILRKILKMSSMGIAFLGVLFVVIGAVKFYGEKSLFRDNFIDHRIYHWEFERARLITTINPEPVKEGISLIKKYSGETNPGIFIISKYDNLLPFLAKRYSLMPFFEMPWHLLSEKEVTVAINKLKSEKPEYIFVDSKIDQSMVDPWAKLYCSVWENKERASRFGRYFELQKIFKAIVNDYEKIDKGELISVYKRTVIK